MLHKTLKPGDRLCIGTLTLICRDNNRRELSLVLDIPREVIVVHEKGNRTGVRENPHKAAK